MFGSKLAKYFGAQEAKISRWKPSNDRLPKMLIKQVEKGQHVPLLEKYDSLTSRYPRRRLDFMYDASKISADIESGYFTDPQGSPLHQVFEYGSEEKKRLSLQQLQTLFACPLSIYALYSLMNYDLYDVPSKVSMLIGLGGYFYLMNHIRKTRAFDAKKVFIAKNFDFLYLALDQSEHSKKYWNLDSETNPVESQILHSLDLKRAKKLSYIKIAKEDILFFGYSKVLDLVNDGYDSPTAEKKYKVKKMQNLEREDKNPLIGTLKEMWGSRAEPLSVVFWSDAAQNYAVSEIRVDCLDKQLEDKIDYLNNLADGYSTKFFD